MELKAWRSAGGIPCDGLGSARSITPGTTVMLGTVLLVVLVLLLIGALPTWPHSKSWGYGPTGGLGLVVVVILVLVLMGRI